MYRSPLEYLQRDGSEWKVRRDGLKSVNESAHSRLESICIGRGERHVGIAVDAGVEVTSVDIKLAFEKALFCVCIE